MVADNLMSLKPCPETYRRGILWPATPGNTNASIKCPELMQGFARWYCNGTTGEWGPGRPNLRNCKTVAFSNVLKEMSNKIDLRQTVKDLEAMVSGLQAGGDVGTAVGILDKVDDIFFSQAPAMSPAQRKKLALDTSKVVINTCDALLAKHDAWKDLDIENRYAFATTLLTSIDQTGRVLASSIETAKHEQNTKNVAFQVLRPDGRSRGHSNLTYQDPRLWSDSRKTSISLMTGSNFKHAVFTVYSELEDILLPHEENNGGNTKIINSLVIGANVSGDLQSKVRIHLSHLNRTEGNTSCAYWDTQSKQWNTDGCKVIETTADYTVCECDHLTNFAILVDVTCSDCFMSIPDKIALAVITIIGCSISIFCLSVCITIFTFYRSLWGMRVTLHRNLCICLLVGQIVLLGGLDRTENKVVCACIAGVLHYFFLSAFFWMFLEAFHIFWLLVKVFNPKESHRIIFYVIGYGCPALILAITAGTQPAGYGTSQYCWLNTEDGTIWGFTGPIICIIAFNAISLMYALYTMHHITKPKDKTQTEDLRMWVRGATVLTPLLGVTWIVGFLYVDGGSVIFAYIFAAVNSLQGLGIFLFHCLLNKKVKEHVWRSFERSSVSRSMTGRGSSKYPSSKSSSMRGSASSKRKSGTKFFVSADHSSPVPGDQSPPVLNEDGEQQIAMLQPDYEKRSRLNTNDLYPLEVDK